MTDPIDPKLLRQLDEEFQDIRVRLGRLPRRAAPPELLHALKQEFEGGSWSARLRAWFSRPAVLRPVGALALAALLAGAWIAHWKWSERQFIDMQPLTTAHARYQDEALMPPADMAGSNFSGQLAMYYGDEN